MTGRTLRLGLAQYSCTEDRLTNLERAQASVRRLASDGAQLVVLPELFQAPYFCQTEDPSHFNWAEPAQGPSVTAMIELARSQGVVLVVPFFERRSAGLYHNSAVVLDESGSQLGMYRKMHIPDDPQYFEKYYFAPGDLGFHPIDTPRARLGVLVCWDQWYPEASRLMALAGAQILVYPTAIGWSPEEKESLGVDQRDAWKTMHRAHAIANGVFVAAVNRVGVEHSAAGQLEFWGHSLVCDPRGRILAEAGETPEDLVVDCDLCLIEQQRQMWPFFRDRRIDAYQGLLARWLDEAP